MLLLRNDKNIFLILILIFMTYVLLYEYLDEIIMRLLSQIIVKIKSKSELLS